MKSRFSTAVLCGIIATGSVAEARSFRVAQLPNGNDFNCVACHTRTNGGGLNPFGLDTAYTLKGSNTDWSAVYALDSDGDGYSNGLELADPNGVWSIGAANPAGMTSNPGRADSTLCGDGIVNGPEECDGNVDGASCSDVGSTGVVTCVACQFDYAACGSTTNTNNATNNATNNQTTGSSTPTNNSNGSTSSGDDTSNNGTSDTTSPAVILLDDSVPDDSSCSATGAAPTIWLALIAFVGFGHRG